MSLSVDGIASGLNTAELVQQLMHIERRPLTLMQQRIQVHQQRIDAWRDVNMRLASLDTKLGDLLLSSTYQARAATSTNADVMTATATAAAVPATYEISVEQLATSHRVVGKQFGVEGQPSAEKPLDFEGTATIQINDIDIEIDGSMSLQAIAEAINQSDADVQATVVDSRLVVEGVNTGEENVIEFGDAVANGSTDGVLQQLGILDGDAIVERAGYRSPSDAAFIINGIDITRATNEISDVVDGLVFTLQSKGQTVIEVTKHVDSAVDKIKDVVDQINSAMQFIGSRLEKDAILQGDSALMRLQTSLRMTLMDRIETEGDIDQLAVIGVRFTREGQLEVDEEKLRAVLSDDPEAVYNLFAGEHGVARETRSLIKSYTQTDGIIANRRDMFQEQIKSTEDSIERLEQRLEQQEERLYRRFGAMEQALAQMQAQSTWLQTQLMQMAMMQQ